MDSPPTSGTGVCRLTRTAAYSVALAQPRDQNQQAYKPYPWAELNSAHVFFFQVEPSYSSRLCSFVAPVADCLLADSEVFDLVSKS